MIRKEKLSLAFLVSDSFSLGPSTGIKILYIYGYRVWLNTHHNGYKPLYQEDSVDVLRWTLAHAALSIGTPAVMTSSVTVGLVMTPFPNMP